MSAPRRPEPSTLVVGVLHSPGVSEGEILEGLAGRFASIESAVEGRFFTESAYYSREMGEGLQRFYCALEGLRDPGELADIKLASNGLEGRWVSSGRRRVNLDPGLLDLTHLVLATGKPAAHRVYVGKGIYGEIEYVFEGGMFRPLPWTYPDYRETRALDFFNRVREAHKAKRRQAAIRRPQAPTTDH